MCWVKVLRKEPAAGRSEATSGRLLVIVLLCCRSIREEHSDSEERSDDL